jgi:hypothetical protein
MVSPIFGMVVVKRADMDAHVNDLKTGALKHHAHQVFADVMQIALDGTQHQRAGRLDTAFHQQRA